MNPVLITESALAGEETARLAEEFAGAITANAGQLCTRPSLLFIPASASGTRFERLLSASVRNASPTDMLSEGIAGRYRSAVAEIRGAHGIDYPLLWTGSNDASILAVPASRLIADPQPFMHEVFGPFALLVRYDGMRELADALELLPGSLTFTIRSGENDPVITSEIIATARSKAGRIVGAGVPTGVAVSEAQMHGGTWPAATSSMHSSVGQLAAHRFLRPVTYQEIPDRLLPPALQNGNPLGIPRRIDGSWTQAPLDVVQ